MIVKVDKMFVLPDAGSLCAFADISFNDELVIKGCRVMSGTRGLFVTMPREQGKDSRWYDQVVCKNSELFEQITSTILAEYVRIVPDAKIVPGIAMTKKEAKVWEALV